MNGRDRIQAVRELMNVTGDRIRKKTPKMYSKDLVEVLFRQPYCKIKFLEEAGIGNRQTASLYLKALADMGVFQSTKNGREIYYINKKFLDALVK